MDTLIYSEDLMKALHDITKLKVTYFPIEKLEWSLKKQQPVAKLGSNCDNGLKAGLFNWNVNNDSSNSNWNIGSQLDCVWIYY